MKVFNVYDSAAEAYGIPVFFKSTGEAVRSFAAAAKDPNTMIAKHPDQFTLFEIGEYDENVGQCLMLHAAKSLGKAIEYLGTSKGA